jgi:hypothetical protein
MVFLSPLRISRVLLLGCVGQVVLGIPSWATPGVTVKPAPMPTVSVCQPMTTGQAFARSELFFGLSKPNGGEVSKKEFQGFIDREVTPRFPDGLTLLSGLGQFKNAKGQIIQERSQVLILLYPLPGVISHQSIEQIRQAYKKAFQQESVLRVDSVSCVDF